MAPWPVYWLAFISPLWTARPGLIATVCMVTLACAIGCDLSRATQSLVVSVSMTLAESMWQARGRGNDRAWRPLMWAHVALFAVDVHRGVLCYWLKLPF